MTRQADFYLPHAGAHTHIHMGTQKHAHTQDTSTNEMRVNENGSSLRVLFQDTGKMDASARDQGHSCIRAKLGLQ